MANKEPNFFQHLRDFAGRMSSGPCGAGVGLKLLIGAGALAYGIKKATSTEFQMVNIALRVLSRPVASNLPYMYQHLGKDYDECALPSIVNEVLKSVAAKFNASQLITQRPQLGEAVTRNPGYLKLRRIRAAQSVAKTVVTSQNRIYLNADSLVLNLQDESSNKMSLNKNKHAA